MNRFNAVLATKRCLHPTRFLFQNHLTLLTFHYTRNSCNGSVGTAWRRLTDDSNDISWIAAGYPEGNTSELVFKAEGSGGMPEFISNLPAADVVWGAFKVVGVDNRGNTISRRPKYIFVKYLPGEVPTMKRARAGGHKGAIKQIIDAHIDVEIESASELTEEVIIQKLRAAGGAHQPTGYEFSNYSS